VRRDADVDDAATLVRHDEQDKEQSIGRGRHDEEVGRHDLVDMIGEEGAPGLGRWTPPPGHVFRDRGLTDLNPKLQQLAVDTGCTSQRIRLSHRAN
jgi:hypothetical protein